MVRHLLCSGTSEDKNTIVMTFIMERLQVAVGGLDFLRGKRKPFLSFASTCESLYQECDVGQDSWKQEGTNWKKRVVF